MLQSMRDKTVGWLAWAVIILIGGPMALWGVDSFFLGGGDPVVAKVGSQKIHQSQFRNQFENRYQQLQRMLGENFRADQFDKTRFEKAVLDDMVQETLLLRYAEEEGYQATDATLFAYLRTIPAFQKDGKFDSATYQETLSRMGRSAQQFEADLRAAMQIEQMRGTVIETSFVTEAEAQLANRLQNQQRWLSYALFEPARYRSEITVTPEQIQERYESAKARYMAPERIKLAYVELALETLPPADVPSDDVLKVMYEAEKAGRFTTPEQRKARHILINFGADKDAAKARIEKLAADLKAGRDFAELARQNSDDTGSREQGGDLGWVRRGQMVAEFESALFNLDAGQTSAPVETQFGWHLIRLDELKSEQVRGFAAVREELIALYREREAQKRYQDYQEKLEQLAFESPSSLEPVARELGLEIRTTDWFTRAGGAGLAANSAVKQAAFSDELLKDNENSKPLSLGEGRVAVVRKDEYEAPRQRPLEEVAGQIEAELAEELARARAQSEAEAALAAAREGTALYDALKARGIELLTPGLVKRDNAGIDRAILEALFKLPRPQDGGASYGKTVLGTGAVAVLALSKVEAPEAAEAITLSGNLRDLRAGAEFNAYRKRIEQQVPVRITVPESADSAARGATADL
jgi:peptidyl-prolyl cis-trans isomerase D